METAAAPSSPTKGSRQQKEACCRAVSNENPARVSEEGKNCSIGAKWSQIIKKQLTRNFLSLLSSITPSGLVVKLGDLLACPISGVMFDLAFDSSPKILASLRSLSWR